MALVVADRVKETTTTTGTGAITLAGAEVNFVAFSSVLSDGDTTYYAIVDDSNQDFEVGLGTYATSGNTLTRTTVLASSNSGSAVDLSAGSKEVFINYPAGKSVYLDGSGQLVIGGTAVTATAAELNFVDGVTSNIQTQIDSIDPVKATQTKTYLLNEASTITLSSAITSGVPVVSVTKEIAQTGTTNNNWQVNSTGENYTRVNSATATTLTPSAVGDGTFTLGTGSFSAGDVGKTIEGNGGVAILTATSGTYITTTDFTDTSAIASGDWEMYAVVYNTTDDDLELSGQATGYELTTASFFNNFSVNGQDTQPNSLFFNLDGTKMYMLGAASDYVYEYNLSTAFSVATAVLSTSFYVGSQETQPHGLAFSDDGGKMFVTGYTGDDVNEYTLSTPFTVNTATVSQTFSISNQTDVVSDIRFNGDGTKMFIASSSPSKIFQYSLATGFDVSTANYDAKELDVSSKQTSCQGLAFNADGSKMFISGPTSSGTVNAYNLSTKFDITTATFYQTLSITQGNNPTGIFLSPDGTKLLLSNTQYARINQYNLDPVRFPSGYHAVHTTVSTDTTYWTDINSMTADESAGDGKLYYAVSTDDRTTWKVAKGTDGERSIVRNSSGTWQYNSNTTYGSETWVNATTNTELSALEESMSSAAFTGSPFSIGEASYASKSAYVGSQETIPRDVKFNTDGTKMFVVGNGTNTVYEYDLTTGFDVSTASYSSTSFSVSSQETTTLALAFNNDGTKMYISGNANGTVYQYGLTTGFDLSTASYSATSFSVTSQDLYPASITFNADGTKMFILGQQNDTAYEYNLSSAFVVSSATYSQSFSVAAQALGPSGISFNTDGTVMIILDITTDKVYEYNLSTGFDLSTASYADSSFSVNAQDATPLGLAFNDDGFKMYIAGSATDYIYQYDTGLADSRNRMNKAQLEAIPDANQFTLANDLDLAVIFNFSSGTTLPASDGVDINYDANTVFQGAVLGTDYNWDFPASDKVRITSLGSYNFKTRIL
jgi:sugar lactone lactonase YvrE